jgi:hypothetical protein
MAAAKKLDIAVQARNDVFAMATKAKQRGAALSDTLVSACSPDPQGYGVKAIAEEQRTWTKRSITRHRAENPSHRS